MELCVAILFLEDASLLKGLETLLNCIAKPQVLEVLMNYIKKLEVENEKSGKGKSKVEVKEAYSYLK